MVAPGSAWRAPVFRSYAFGWLVFALHLAAGVTATSYRRSAPWLVSAYGAGALASAIAELAVASFAYPELGFPKEYFDGLRKEIAIASMVWPLIALILINLPRARRACTR